MERRGRCGRVCLAEVRQRQARQVRQVLVRLVSSGGAGLGSQGEDGNGWDWSGRRGGAGKARQAGHVGGGLGRVRQAVVSRGRLVMVCLGKVGFGLLCHGRFCAAWRGTVWRGWQAWRARVRQVLVR